MKRLFATNRTLTSLALALMAGIASAHASAAPLINAQGDFLPSYVGPKDADLDVRFADA
jgi:hypothetical protein